MIYFNNDYMRGCCREVLDRLVATNMESSVGYGFDKYTAEARQMILNECGLEEGNVFFLVGGTQTNATVIDGLLRHHEGVLCAPTGHINVHESGAVEASGHKVIPIPAYNGKLRAADIDKYITDFYADATYEHMVAPGMVYISQPTELGTLYSLAELEEMSTVCRRHSIPLFADGARLSYGLTSDAADFTMKDMARLCDVFYIGGTKCGALFGEAVVCTNPSLLHYSMPLVKQHGALLAKGRLLGLQFATLFGRDESGIILYERLGRHANRMASKLCDVFRTCGFASATDSSTNQRFFRLPNKLIDVLAEEVGFEIMGSRGAVESEVRFVTDWSTSESDVDRLLEIMKSLTETE